MEIRPTTDEDLDVFVDTLHAAFGRFPETPAESGGGVWWSALEMDRNLLAMTADGRPVGSVELLRRAECGEILEEVYDRYRRAQPGALSRPHRWWTLGAGQPPSLSGSALRRRPP